LEGGKEVIKESAGVFFHGAVVEVVMQERVVVEGAEDGPFDGAFEAFGGAGFESFAFFEEFGVAERAVVTVGVERADGGVNVQEDGGDFVGGGRGVDGAVAGGDFDGEVDALF
jgi:hypothetical protein